MKVRTGFVSNSSSSSFIIIGIRRGDFNEIDKIEFKKDKLYTLIGDYLDEGIDVIQFDMRTKNGTQLLQWFLDNKDKVYSNRLCTIYEVLDYGHDEFTLDSKALAAVKEPIRCTSYEMDECSTETIEEAEERYLRKE